MCQQYDFSDIAPFEDSVFSAKMAFLVNEPGFEHAVRYVMPQVDYPAFKETLLSIPNKDQFQSKIMFPFLEMLAQRTTSGITCSGLENISQDKVYTFVTNHRDIVLDASFLNLCFLRNGFPTSEVGIGNNLLIYEWITDLVKLNRSFIVKRNLRMSKALEAAKELSSYIHYAITQKHRSVWIAQREGRAKDSNDLTQEGVIKMLGLCGGDDFAGNIEALNIVPVSISYEYDPNDYLKAREFLLKRLNPDFRKSPHDDLLSMETGLLQPKGRIHFAIGKCINDQLSEELNGVDRHEAVKRVCKLLDCTIHEGYRLYPVNYIASDLLHNSTQHASEYTPEQLEEFRIYLSQQLDKVVIEGSEISALDRKYMTEMMLTMYSNPLKNKKDSAKKCESI